MKIYFQRSGGFAGIISNVTVDTESLPPQEARQVEDMIERTHFFDLPLKSNAAPKGAADYFTYKITVDSGERRKSVEYTEPNLQPPVKALVDLLLKKFQKSQVRNK